MKVRCRKTEHLCVNERESSEGARLQKAAVEEEDFKYLQ